MSRIRNYLGRNLSSERTEDKLTKENRSKLMSKIKSKKTKFELLFFASLESSGINFETHPKDIFGHPDIIIRDRNLCVFIDSDFWHGWQYPRWKHKLKNDFWRNKIEKNRKRDISNSKILKRKGYKILRIWEHQIKKNETECIFKIKNLL